MSTSKKPAKNTEDLQAALQNLILQGKKEGMIRDTELNALLEKKVKGKYALLTDEEILELLVNRKWYYSIFEGIKALYVTAYHNMANRIIELAVRYEYVLPWLTKESELLEAKVKAHLERMGFVW